MVEIERHPVEITPAALALLEEHGRMIVEIAAQFARDREDEGGGENVRGYYGVGASPNEAVGARYAPGIGKTIIWRVGEMDFDPEDLRAVEDQRPGGWGPHTWLGEAE